MDTRAGRLTTSAIPRPRKQNAPKESNAKYQGHTVQETPDAQPKAKSELVKKPDDLEPCPKLTQRSAKQVMVSVGTQLALVAGAAYIVYCLSYLLTESYLNFFEDLSGCDKNICPKGYDAYAGSQDPQNLRFLYVGLGMVGITLWKVRKFVWKGVDWLFTLSASQQRKQDTIKLQQHVVKSVNFVQQNEAYIRQLAEGHNKVLSLSMNYKDKHYQ